MIFSIPSKPLTAAIAVTLAATLIGCSSVEQASKYRDHVITINGHDDDWEGQLIYYEKEKIGVGISNDADNLYLAIKTLDRPTMMKIVRTGMTIWFDSTGSSKKIFGIRFPLGFEDRSFARGLRPDANGTMDGGDRRTMRERYGQTLREIEVIGPNPLDRKRLPVESSHATHGIKVGMSDSLDALVYELVVPLHSSTATPLAIGSDAGKAIGLGIETTDAREQMRQRRPENEGGEMPRVGVGGAGAGMGGGMRGGGRGRGGFSQPTDESAEPLKLWIDVTLAK